MDTPPSPRSPHGIRRMGGRDPGESFRVASPLELLLDLTFVIAFGVAGNQAAHLIAEGHVASGIAAFGFAMWAVCWAWVNFAWFASAFDTDDWLYRIATMLQMLGVLILALGLPAMFASIDEGDYLDNRIVVLGYVVMRVGLVGQWLRVAKQNETLRRTALTYAGFVSIAQLGWITLIFVDVPVWETFLLTVPLIVLELLGPVLGERTARTPWHPHHIAERYSLLTIIALGEVIVGTVASLGAVVDLQGWDVTAAVTGLAGVGLTFGLWWVYFQYPFGDALHHHRSRSFGWGYGHIVVFAALAAVGAGLHVAGYHLEHESHVSTMTVLATVAIPVAVYLVALAALYSRLVGVDLGVAGTTVAALVVLGAAVTAGALGVPVPVCLLIVAAAPVVIVVADETVLWKRREAALARLRAS
ncbi:low temperature requirement protein A [Rhodococcus sp. NPDC003383]